MFWQINLIPLQCKGHFCVNKEAWSTFASSAYSCALRKSPLLSCDSPVVTAARPAARPPRVMAHPSRAGQGSRRWGAGQKELPLDLSKSFKSTQVRNIHFQCQGTHGWGQIFLQLHGKKNKALGAEPLLWIPVHVALLFGQLFGQRWAGLWVGNMCCFKVDSEQLWVTWKRHKLQLWTYHFLAEAAYKRIHSIVN